MNQLKRVIGTRELVVHYVSSVMGVGVLVLPGVAFSIAGPASLVVWLLLVLFSYPFALIFARLSMRFPNSRGAIDFVAEAFGPAIASKIGLFLLITLIVANPLLGITAARYLGGVMGITVNRDVLALGYLLILASVFVNFGGIQISVRTQSVLLTILIVFITSVCLFVLVKAKLITSGPFLPHGIAALGPAAIVCFFGFVGWENAAPVAEEVKEPVRTFPKAILIGVIAVGAVYLLMAGTIILIIPLETAFAAGATSFSHLLTHAGGKEASVIGSLVAAGLMIMTTNAWTLGTSRYLFGLARSGDLPRCLATISGSRLVPRRAITALGVLYGLTVFGLWIADGTEMTIINLSSSGFLLFFLVCFVSANRVLSRHSDRILAVGLSIVTATMLAINISGIAFCLVTWIATEAVYWLRRRSVARMSHTNGG